jgi:hypothetical protein
VRIHGEQAPLPPEVHIGLQILSKDARDNY